MCTWPQERKRLVKVLLFHVGEHIAGLGSDLFVCAKHHDQEPIGSLRKLGALQDVQRTRLVYESDTRLLCQSAACTSVQSPRIEAAIEAAADKPPVIARWMPDEKKGSINAGKNVGTSEWRCKKWRETHLRHRRRS